MTDQEEEQFRRCYHWLCAAWQKKRDVNEYDVFLATCRPLSLPAIEAATLALCRQGTGTDGRHFFPKAPELFGLALRFEKKALEAAIETHKSIPVAADQVAADMPGLGRAKAKAIRELKKAYPGAEKILQAIPIRHPMEGGWICVECRDSGSIVVDDKSTPCHCAEKNPVVRLKFLGGVRAGILSVDRELATRRSDFAPLIGDGSG